MPPPMSPSELNAEVMRNAFSSGCIPSHASSPRILASNRRSDVVEGHRARAHPAAHAAAEHVAEAANAVAVQVRGPDRRGPTTSPGLPVRRRHPESAGITPAPRH